MWYALTAFLILGGLGLHLAWRRRAAGLQARLAGQGRELTTLRQQHEEGAAQKEAEQQALFNSMTEGVLVLDGSGRIQMVNQSAQRLFNLNADVRGQSLLEAFRWPELAEIVKRLPAERAVQGFELELPGMEERWLEVNAAAVLDREGTQLGALLVFHDLTRLKQLENTRQEFVANVSHELRTPLSLIKGYVETLIEGARNDPQMTLRFLQTIEKHTDRLTFLIEDLLTISQLERGQVVMNVQPVELRGEAERVIEDLASRAEEKKVAVRNLVPRGLAARADGDRLQQVLFNLVENAIKYGHDDGCVTIGGRALPDGNVEMWVEDDGPGIPPESLERVFERFYRADRARSRERGGTGLGLSIVKHIVQAHGGEVWVKSELGVGTTFFFTLSQGEARREAAS